MASIFDRTPAPAAAQAPKEPVQPTPGFEARFMQAGQTITLEADAMVAIMPAPTEPKRTGNGDGKSFMLGTSAGWRNVQAGPFNTKLTVAWVAGAKQFEPTKK